MSVFASSSDLTNENYYTTIFSYDFHKQTDAVSELTKTGDSNSMTKGYFKEQDGNIAWYGYRAVQNSSGNWTNAGFSIPSSAAMASGKGDDCGGEYVIQSRFLFMQQSYKIGNLTLQTQLDDADDKFSQDYAGVTQMGLQFSNLSVKDSFENTPVFYFKSIVKNSEGNGVWAPAYNITLHTVQFNGNTWYTFRQTYNLDIKTYRIEIYNAAGNKVYDESVELPTKENGGKIAVPYNSKTPVMLTVKPSSGYEVKVGGVSKRKVTEISLTENEVGKFVRVGIVAKNDAAELNTSGDPVYSSAFGPVSAMKTAPWIKENSAKIAGSGNVGRPHGRIYI